MTPLGDFTPFFNLPLELREYIYKEVLASPVQGPELLRTCREIKTEAHKFLFQRPLHFHSQVSLYQWLDQATPESLTHVTQITLNVQDVDLRTILRLNTLPSQSSAPPRLLTWQLYEADLLRLSQSLKKLPKVKNLTIRALPNRQSFLYREFLTKVFGMLSSLYPTLQKLRLEGNMRHQSLAFLTSLKHLKSLTFDGFSSSSATETASTLSSLEHLTDLALISPHEVLTAVSPLYRHFTAKRKSFTGDVVRNINQLTSFSVTERIPASSPTLFFNSEVLAALHTHETLKNLSVLLSRTPDAETLGSLRHFLERSFIERLELDWPELNLEVLQEYSLVPESTRALWVRARSSADAAEILCSLCKRRRDSGLPKLWRIALVRTSKDCDVMETAPCARKDSCICTEDTAAEDSDEGKIARRKRELEALSVQVAWCTEES